MSLCPDRDRRAAMTDDEFWQDVAENLGYGHPSFGHPDDGDEPLDIAVATIPCTECGSVAACAWDSEGRPLIHVTNENDQ